MANLLQYGMPLPKLNFDKNCHQCSRGEGNAIGGCIQNGDLTNLRLVVISDYPGHYESEKGHTFYDNESDRIAKRKAGQRLRVGWPNAGNYIRRKLEDMGLDTYREVYFTNVIKCQNNSSKLNPDEKKELKSCVVKWLVPELELIYKHNPTIPILLAGKYAYIAFRSDKKMIPYAPPFNDSLPLRNCRRKMFMYRDTHPVFVTVNPAAAANSIPKLELGLVSQKSNLTNIRELKPIVGTPDWHYTNDLKLLSEWLHTHP